MSFLAAAIGAISGLGGGIFIMPLLVEMLSRDYSPASLASLSLSVVLINGLTSLFLGQQIRFVDKQYAFPTAIFSVFGVIAGVFLQSHVSRESFEVYLSFFLLLLGIYIFWRSPVADKHVSSKPSPFHSIDAGFAIAVGTIASFFGVGGGVLQVPYMVYARHRLVKQSTATSQVILAFVAFVSLILFVGIRRVPVPWATLFAMAPAVVAGGYCGSWLARRLRGPWVVRLLAVILLFLSYRLASKAIW